jgi:hypothetical protein
VNEIVKVGMLRRISCPESRISSLPYQPLVTSSILLRVTPSWMLRVHGEVVSAFSRWPKQDLGNLRLQVLIGWNGDRINTDRELRKKELLKRFHLGSVVPP